MGHRCYTSRTLPGMCSARSGTCWPRFCCCSCKHAVRAVLRKRSLWMVVGLLLVASSLVLLHVVVLPASMGYYDDECLLQAERREQMRFVLHHIVQFFNEENATYWLDFGTLLGIVREGDIIPYDGDLDLSRLADNLTEDRILMDRFATKMKSAGIIGTAMTAKYKNVTADLFRFQTKTSSTGESVLKVYYPFVPKVTFAESISNYFFPPEIDVKIVFPLKEIGLTTGINAKIPIMTFDFLRLRYPITWSRKFPYKWRCWTGSTKS